MTPPCTGELVERGTAEGFKCGVHLALFGLAVAALGYNAMAWSERRQFHLARNVVVYASFAAYEAVMTMHHRECPTACP